MATMHISYHTCFLKMHLDHDTFVKVTREAGKAKRWCLSVVPESPSSGTHTGFIISFPKAEPVLTQFSAEVQRVSHNCCYHGYSLFHIVGVQCTSSVTGKQHFCCFNDRQQS